MSFILIGSLFIILFYISKTMGCPNNYNNVAGGCYKIVNGSNSTLPWSEAGQFCRSDKDIVNMNASNARCHLVALENVMEKNSLTYWLKAYAMQGEFWTDGVLSTSLWNWSNQSIVWYFEASERNITGDGSNYKLVSNATATGYLISDDMADKSLNFICEYQVPCTGNNSCQNNATCYDNVGESTCICAPGFTGQLCDSEIDECLSSPCLHDGNCTDQINNYTCDCSNTFYEGANCEIPQPDPTLTERSAAFWSVAGVVAGLVVLLTLSDLPWEDIFTAIGCSCRCFTCCSKKIDPQQINENDHGLSDSPTNDQNNGLSAPKKTNYHVVNTVWDTEYARNQTPTNPQYNGYLSPEQHQTFNNLKIQSYVELTQTKQKPQTPEDNRIYAVNIKEPTSKTKDPSDTMVNWTQQLQEQLKTKRSRETSVSSTKQLVHSTNSNDC